MKTQKWTTSVSTLSVAAFALAAGLAFTHNTALAGDHQGQQEQHQDRDGNRQVMWLNHFDLLSGDDTVLTTSHNSTSSGVGGGLTGLVIQSSTVGDTDSFNGNKVVHMALDLPKQTKVTGVRVCYENSSGGSFISQIRLAQVQNPPDSAAVVLDDGTDLTDPGPICVNSAAATPAVKAQGGPLLLSLRVFTADPADKIVIRGLGILVK